METAKTVIAVAALLAAAGGAWWVLANLFSR